MKKLFLLFLATAAMTLVSCGGSSSEGSSASSTSADTSTEMDAVVDNVPTVEQVADSTVAEAAAEQVSEEPASEPTTCSKCGVSGEVRCSKCGGKVYTSKTTLADEGYWTQYYGCKKCGGRGYKTSEGYSNEHMRKGSGKMKCPKCHGTGHE